MARRGFPALLIAAIAAGPSCGGAAVDTTSVPAQRTPSPEAYEQYLLGAISAENGDPETAAARLEAAVALDPADPFLRVEHARALTACGLYDVARREIARALLFEPAFETAWLALAELHVARGDPAEAERAGLEGIRAVPDGARILLWLARFYRGKGETERALEIARRAAAADPDLAEASAEIAELAADSGKIDEASESLAAYRARRPADARLLEEVARAAAAAGRAFESIELLEAAARADGADDALRAELVEALLEAGLWERAKDRILELNAAPDDAELVRRARWLLSAQAPWKARRLLGERATSAGASPAVRVAAAEVELALRREEAAAQLLAAPEGGWSPELEASVRELKSRAKAP